MSNKENSREEKSTRLSLGLEENEDDDDATEQPRRFVTLSSHLLAYGGDNGSVSCLVSNERGTKGGEKGPGSENKFVIVQRYDDEVRNIAVSKDGKRLAVGFDTGSTQVYCFDDLDSTSSVHPYVRVLEKIKASNGNSGDDDDLMLSQDCGSDDNSTYFAGPEIGAPIRDMLFLPHSSETDKGGDDDASSSASTRYILAIASEAGMCVIDVTSKDIMADSGHLLESEAKEFHDQSGIRGLSASNVEIRGRNNKVINMTILASLAMDGRLCLWDVTNMKLLHREEEKCVPKKDLGEIHDADAYDRSCRPVLCNANRAGSNSTTSVIISTPGKLTPYLRVLQLNVDDDNDGIKSNLQIVKESAFQSATEKGAEHIQSIVSVYFCSVSLMVTSGRDGRVLLWEGQNTPSCDEETSVHEENNSFINKKWTVTENYQSEFPVSDFCIQKYQDKRLVSLFAACANGSLQVFDISKHRHLLSNSTIAKVRTDNASLTTTTNEAVNKTTGVKSRSQNASSTVKRILKNSDLSDDGDESIDFSSSPRSSKKNVHFLDEAEENSCHEDDQDKTNLHSSSANSSDNGATDFDHDSVGSDHSLTEEDVSQHKFIRNHSRILNDVQPQPAFSPSSTPLDLKRRFLCWNHMGSVTILQGDDQRNTVDITFTESAVRRPISFTDNLNFIIGSVGESGGIFASDLQEPNDDIFDGDDIDGLDELNMSERTKQAVRRDRRKRDKGSDNSRPTGSSIFFYRFESIGNKRNKDWHMILPNGERVLGAACGEGWSAVMTSRRFLRLFSSGGNQNQLIWLKGDPVTMVGRGRFLAVFYHETSPLANKTQQLGYCLWDAKNLQMISRGSVSCVSTGSSISWVGFNNDFSLVVMDSDGMLSMLVATGPCDNAGTTFWEWVPVLDTIGLRKSTDDNYWPITLHNGTMVCIPLKGGMTYPDASRRPVTSTLGLRMPFARSILSKNSVLEELSVRSNIALAQKKFVNEIELSYDAKCDGNELEKEYNKLSKQVDKVTIKLFAAMVDSGKIDNAFELVGRLHSEKSFEIAMRYADRHSDKLAGKIEKEMDLKFGAEESDNEEYDTDQGDYNESNKARYSSTLMNNDENIQTKQISPDYGRTQKRSIKLHQSAGGSKKHRVN